tara:strand:+ start:541 stop:1632 length:1092 start_codon:yes stop_codon:yes gene_type:complete
MHTYVIAELGVNHNGKIDLAKELIDSAVYAGADAVKFQLFSTEQLVSDDAPLASYQTENVEKVISQKQLLNDLQLTESQFLELYDYSMRRGVDFLCTPFDVDSLKFLVEDLKLKKIKIASPDITNSQLLFNVGRYNVDVILSTGMCLLADIEFALGVLATGFITPKVYPTEKNIVDNLRNIASQKLLKEKVTLLHCNSDYPTKPADVNLNAIKKLSEVFGLKVGYSDHTKIIEVAMGAVALGARVIEKHLTINNSLPGPDHKASIEPKVFKEMVTKIRIMEEILGEFSKLPTSSEMENKTLLRRSIVARKYIAKGELFTENNLMATRPGTGISAKYFYDYIGEVASENYKEGQAISGLSGLIK